MPTQVADPFAAIATPATPPAAAPPAAAPAADPFAAIAKAPTAPAPMPPAAPAQGGLGGWLEKNMQNPDVPADEGAWAIARGGVKSGGRALATFLDLAAPQKPSIEFEAGYKMQHPNATPEEIQKAWLDPKSGIGARIAGHLRDASTWLKTGSEPEGFWEHVGAIGEQILEYVGTDGLLKMAGSGVRATELGARAVTAADHLKQAQQVATTLQQNPRLAGLAAIGLKASQDAATMGAQTYIHTEDPTQAAIGAVMGGGTSAVMGGAQSYLSRIAPKNLTIAGEEMPALASQVNEAGQPIDTGAIGAPGIARAQQRGAQKVIQNTAAQATAQAIDQINQTRPIFEATQDASRMLPAPETAQPFTFKLETPGEEGTTGKMAQSAAKVPGRAAFKEPQFTTASAPTREPIRPGGPTAAEGQTGADIRSATTPEAKADVTQAGNLQTTDPKEAQSWLRGIEDFQSTPEHAKLSPAEQARIEARRATLQEQLGLYWNSPYPQRFMPANIWDSIENVRTFGDAADQIHSVAEPVYQRLDQVSDGNFNKYKEAAKQAEKIMRSATSVEAYESAAQRLSDANKAIGDIIDKNAGEVSRADYLAAKNAWRMGSRMDELHTHFERMMNGVTMEESDQGLTRVMTGRAKQLEAYLAVGTNREQIEQLIGKEGVTNLKRITLLLAKANTSRTVHDVVLNVANELHQVIRTGGIPELVAGGISSKLGAAVGIPGYQGFMAGALGARAVLRIAATSPRVGNMVEYAARNGISVQHYAPLIARAIAEPFEQPKGPEDEGESATATSSREQ